MFLYHLTPTTEEANDNDHETSNETATEPRRSTRDRATPDWYDPCLNVMIVDNNDEDPATYEEAMMSPDSNKWQEAMKSEMGSMYDNKVWTLVELPDSRKAVENKWIFKRKTDVDVPDVIPDITRSSGMVRRIRFIYRMSFYVNKMMRKVLWKVLEGSRKVRKKPPRKVESTRDSTSMAASPSGVESQVDSTIGARHPHMGGGIPPLGGSPS
ncbi:hypothetical protein QYE76_049454 [Lolium multiflorum]|uniref:Uncharacterized protein n=1 Tax=Lolium multiflorum TaxID=4521 RepID=A0AAD8SNY0_LOLMU|nr:hypothetical protein QYE76_049454 [Lolium multiflorum]